MLRQVVEVPSSAGVGEDQAGTTSSRTLQRMK